MVACVGGTGILLFSNITNEIQGPVSKINVDRLHKLTA